MKDKNGFTLVEIMIVVAIIFILAAIAVPNLIRARINANEATAKAALKSISTALENYASINSRYPADINELITSIPPYLGYDYFTGVYNGYTFTLTTLSNYAYSVSAYPQSANQGTTSFTITTGGTFSSN